MKRIAFIALATILLVSCKNKNEAVNTADGDTLTVVTDSVSTADTLSISTVDTTETLTIKDHSTGSHTEDTVKSVK
jgi:uncharacterized protein YcfL